MNETNSLKKFIKLGIVLVVALLLIIVGNAAWNYQHSFQKLTVTYKSEDISSADLYPAVVQNGNLRATGELVEHVASGQTYKLKKGLYLLRPTGVRITTDDIPVNLGDIPVDKTLDPDYSTEYLKTLLLDEEPAIKAAILASDPQIAGLYKVNSGVLYQRGEWYGTTLSYKGTQTLSRDTLRLVAHKVKGEWVVVTNPPQISLSGSKYPTVPHAVLAAVNAIDIGLPEIVKQ